MSEWVYITCTHTPTHPVSIAGLLMLVESSDFKFLVIKLKARYEILAHTVKHPVKPLSCIVVRSCSTTTSGSWFRWGGLNSLSGLLVSYTVQLMCNRRSGSFLCESSRSATSPQSRWCVMWSSRNPIAAVFSSSGLSLISGRTPHLSLWLGDYAARCLMRSSSFRSIT